MNWVSIDFGTSYSSATILVDNKPVKVHPMGGLYNMYGFPTVAYIESPAQIRVCNAAIPWRCKNPEKFIKDFKLNIHEDEIAYLNVQYADIISEILKHIKQSAEYALGNESIEGVVLTIPATYTENDPRKHIMYEAAKASGFKEIEFVKEAEAAAIYYHSIQRDQSNSLTLIYDLGGGTFDTALVEHAETGYKLLGTSSGSECGGKYFEAALYRHFKSKYELKFSEDEEIRVQQIDGISKLCKDIKEALSSQLEVAYPVPLMNDITFKITRKEFENLVSPLLEKTFQECTALIASVEKKWKDVSRVLLIGGSTVIPCVKTLMRSYLVGQNGSDIPIVLNKSEEGAFIDTLFAVSIGGLLSHLSMQEKDCDSTIETDNANFQELACAYLSGNGVEKNWIKAAYYFNKDYIAKNRDTSFEELKNIYQTLLDRLEIDNGTLIFKQIVPIVGDDAIEQLVDLLMILQEDFETSGYNNFIQEIFSVNYWIPKTEKIICNKIQ